MKISRLLRIHIYGRKKVRLSLLVALALALILVAAGRIINSPATGSITQPGALVPQTGSSVLAFTESSKQYDGKYISFTYPANYRTGYSNLSGSYLDVHRIYSPNSDRFITVGLIRESVENDPGVLYRQNHPDIYKPQPAPAGSLIFQSRQNGFERTVFITHLDLVISIAATDTTGRDLTADQQQVINSLIWK